MVYLGVHHHDRTWETREEALMYCMYKTLLGGEVPPEPQIFCSDSVTSADTYYVSMAFVPRLFMPIILS